MKPEDTGRQYDRIAEWWDCQQDGSTTGLAYVRRTILFAANRGKALDVGCGSGGRIIDTLTDASLQVVGLDVSETMLRLARKRHPGAQFIHADICTWQPPETYDVVIAWDSTFHVPKTEQGHVVAKLCDAVAPGGAILFTAGGIDGEITGAMNGQKFYYSSLSDAAYLHIINDRGCKCILLERDQHPAEHLVMIGIKN